MTDKIMENMAKSYIREIPEGYEARIEGNKVIIELAESEDERVRKQLIETIDSIENFPDKDTAIAYLEKQKEHKPNIELIQRSWYMEGYHDREFGKEPKWIVKTGEGGPHHELNPRYGEYIKKEQKPVEWSEEDEEKLKAICTYLRDYSRLAKLGDELRFNEYCDFLKSLRPQKLDASKLENFDPVEVLNKIKTEWPMAWEKVVGKQEWSEEDEIYLQDALWCVKQAVKVAKSENDMGACWSAERWLKSLRPSWKPSEQEKGALRTAIYVLTEERNFPKAAAQLQNILDAFEGKESRKDWKPSEEQMNALNFAITYFMHETSYKNPTELRDLYEDLLKLKGGVAPMREIDE